MATPVTPGAIMMKYFRLIRSAKCPMTNCNSDGACMKTVSKPASVLDRENRAMNTGSSGAKKAVYVS